MAQRAIYQAGGNRNGGGGSGMGMGGGGFNSSTAFERGTNSRAPRGATRGRGTRGGRGGGRGGGAGGDGGGHDGGGGPAFVRGGRGTRGARGTRGGRGGSTRGGGSGGGGRGGGDDSATLELSGFPTSVSYQDMVNFINHNAPAGFSYIRLSVAGGLGQMTLHASDVSGVMAALGGQQVVPGFPLVVQIGMGGGRSLSQPDKETLRNMVRQTYDQTNKTLNLQAMASYAQGQAFVNFQNTSFTTELLNTIAAIAPDVVTLNLNQNAIQSLSGLVGLIRVMPGLINLSLSNNQLASVEQLESLSGYRDKLRELILTQNPLSVQFTAAPGAPAQSAAQLDYSVYQQYVSSIFPVLQRLDGHPLNALIEFDLPLSLSASAPTALPAVKDSFFDSDLHQQMVFAFVQKFFALYDGDRQNRSLFSVYHDHASFSMQYQPEPKFSHLKYTEMNRNIALLAGAGPKARLLAEQKLLKIGPVLIVAAICELPASKHDVASFVADVCKVPSQGQIGSLLHVNIKGSFIETDSVIRHFHRTFLLSPPTADAQRNGWPVCILHDTLYVGATHKFGAAAPATLAAMSPVANVALSPEDHLMIARLCQMTGIDQATAMQMLLACQGNFEQAVQQVGVMKQQGLL